MKLNMFKTVRDTEVQVFAEDFDGDPSVGVGYGPELVYAKTLDGEDFELTDEESEAFGIEFGQMYYESDDDFD